MNEIPLPLFFLEYKPNWGVSKETEREKEIRLELDWKTFSMPIYGFRFDRMRLKRLSKRKKLRLD